MTSETIVLKSTDIAAAATRERWRPLELTVVVPTFNESDNVEPLLARLENALEGIVWEAVFVDDDLPDETAERVRKIARRQPRVRVIHRIGRRGLASACVEGVLSSSAPYVAVIDADMQHDETILPRMLKRLKEEGLDIVVGSRYVEGGNISGWENWRQVISRAASRAARLVIKVDLQDPMSGFFIMRRQAFDEEVRNLSQQGFKILLDLFASAPRPLRFAELPYHFRQRKHGESKLDGMAVWEYGMLLSDKLFGRFISPRFLLFCIVGGFGLFVHMVALGTALYTGFAFLISQTIAAICSTGSNFILNNVITYRDQRRTGWGLVLGLLYFYAICSVGLLANIGIARFVYAEQPLWWLAGLPGAIVGVVWNYTASAVFIWNRR